MIGLTPTTFLDLHRLAEQLGVQLVRHSGGQKGWYNPRTRTISTRRGMSIIQYKSTLAHELGHAYYGDTPTCLLYTSPSPRDGLLSRMPSSA